MSGVYFFFKFLKVICLLSPFEKLPHSLFYLSILFLAFFSSTCFKCVYGPLFIVSYGPRFWSVRATLQIQLFISFLFISKLKLFEHSSCFLLILNITLASLIRCIISFLFFPSSVIMQPRSLNFQESGENYIMRSSTIHTARPILCGW